MAKNNKAVQKKTSLTLPLKTWQRGLFIAKVHLGASFNGFAAAAILEKIERDEFKFGVKVNAKD